MVGCSHTWGSWSHGALEVGLAYKYLWKGTPASSGLSPGPCNGLSRPQMTLTVCSLGLPCAELYSQGLAYRLSANTEGKIIGSLKLLWMIGEGSKKPSEAPRAPSVPPATCPWHAPSLLPHFY